MHQKHSYTHNVASLLYLNFNAVETSTQGRQPGRCRPHSAYSFGNTLRAALRGCRRLVAVALVFIALLGYTATAQTDTADHSYSRAHLKALKRQQEVRDSLEKSLPSYVRIMPDDATTEDMQVPDTTFYRDSGRTIFKVNRTELNYNDPFLKELRDSVLPLANENGWSLEHMEVRGAASPEGPYLNNVRLSKGRAAALNDFMRAHLDSVADNNTVTVAEDYQLLLWMLEQAGDGAAPRVRQIIERNNGDPALIKAAMQRVQDGRMWNRLLRDYFPKLRAARVMLYFKRYYPYLMDMDLPSLGINTEVLPPAVEISGHLPIVMERPHLMSISTNLLYDAFYMPHYGWAPMPNVGLEFFPRKGNFTFRAQMTFPYYHRWDKHKFFQIRDYHLEVRRYFKPGFYHTGAYLGLYANATKYGIGYSKTKGWEGEGIGGALKVGYVLPLGNSRWHIDFHLGIGGFWTKYDPYVYGNPISGVEDGDYYYDWTGGSATFKKRNHHRTWFGPTEIGITISYDVLFHRYRKKGASFLRKEVIP